MKTFLLLLKKDQRCEKRTREVFLLQFSVALLIAFMFSSGFATAFLSQLERTNLIPLAIWITFIFSATIAISRSFDYEVELRGIDGLRTAGVDPTIIYLSKFCSNTLITLISHSLSTLAITLFINPLPQTLAQLASVQFLLLSLLVIIGYSALATLLSAVSLSARMRGLLLPAILLPLLFPLFFAALELTTMQLENTFAWQTPFAILIVAFDLIYVVTCSQLFGVATRE